MIYLKVASTGFALALLTFCSGFDPALLWLRFGFAPALLWFRFGFGSVLFCGIYFCFSFCSLLLLYILLSVLVSGRRDLRAMLSID